MSGLRFTLPQFFLDMYITLCVSNDKNILKYHTPGYSAPPPPHIIKTFHPSLTRTWLCYLNILNRGLNQDLPALIFSILTCWTNSNLWSEKINENLYILSFHFPSNRPPQGYKGRHTVFNVTFYTKIYVLDSRRCPIKLY